MIENITVYLGSSGHARDLFQNTAVQLGKLIAQHNKHLIYGGMDAGLMGKLAKSALLAGGAVTGIIPRKLQDSERMLDSITKTLVVEELCDRKRLMFEEADAVIALPGGFGTLDEALEVLYWGSLGLHSKPILFVNTEGYWDDLFSYIKDLPDFNPDYFLAVDSVEEALPALESWNALTPIETPAHMPHFEDEIARDTDQPIIIDKASIENTYFAVCALGLKQLAKHKRAIGFINENDKFTALLNWIDRAHKEKFITDKCISLFDAAPDFDSLYATLSQQKTANIDLHKEKWGPADS